MEYLDILNNINEEDQEIKLKPHDRVLIIDGLNLFFRNFATINLTNNNGAHIGGLGGFLRSIMSKIKNISIMRYKYIHKSIQYNEAIFFICTRDRKYIRNINYIY